MLNSKPSLDLGQQVHAFTLSTEVAKSDLVSFPKFLVEHSNSGRFGTIVAGSFRQIAGEHGKFLVFNATRHQNKYSANVRIKLDSPLSVSIFSEQGANGDFNKRLEDYLLLTLQIFEESLRKDMLYMGFVPGSEKTSRLAGKANSFEKLFRGNMINVFLISIILSVGLLLLLQGIGLDWAAPLIMMATMLSVVLSAGKIIAITSDWRINEDHQEVVIVEFHLESESVPEIFRNRDSVLAGLKKQIYDEMTNFNPQLGSAKISEMFAKAGIRIEPEKITVKRINVYQMVKKAADQFDMPVPAIVVTKNPAPNAAAMGFSRNLATMLITFGLIVQLEKREMDLVIGHELSHLRFGDPAILFSVIVAEYMFRVYVLAPNLDTSFLGNFSFSFSILYIIMIFWLIFFFAKFLEARADLESAYILKDPQTLATSLKKIGFKRLLLDAGFIEGRQSTFGDWLAFDPHPPIGFRIRRLESLDMTQVPKHPFLQSVRDVFGGISSSTKKESGSQ